MLLTAERQRLNIWPKVFPERIATMDVYTYTAAGPLVIGRAARPNSEA